MTFPKKYIVATSGIVVFVIAIFFIYFFQENAARQNDVSDNPPVATSTMSGTPNVSLSVRGPILDIKEVLYIPPDSELVKMGNGTTTRIIIKLSEILNACPTEVSTSNSDISREFNRNFWGNVLTQKCAYMAFWAPYPEYKYPTLIFSKIADGKPESFVYLSGGWQSYISYNGKLYYRNKALGVDPTLFSAPSGTCSPYKTHAIIDGTIWIGGEKTEIPSSFCQRTDFWEKDFSSDSEIYSFLYKGRSSVYLLSTYNLSDLDITRLDKLDPLTVQKISTSSDPWFFSDGRMVVQAEYDHFDPDPYWGPRTTVLPIADPKTFEVLNSTHYRDSTTVYFYDSPIPGANPQTFQSLGPTYARDSRYAYYQKGIVPGADSSSFRVIADYGGGFESLPYAIGRDNFHLFFDDKKVVDVSREAPLVIYDRWAWHDASLYFSDQTTLYAFLNGTLLKSPLPEELKQPGSRDKYFAGIECKNQQEFYFIDYDGNKIRIETPLVDLQKFCLQKEAAYQ